MATGGGKEPSTKALAARRRREAKTDEQREARLAAKRERLLRNRDNETPQQMEARLHADRERCTARMENETPQQSQHCLETQQQRQAAACAVENDQHRMARLEQDRLRHQRRPQELRNLFRAAVSGTLNAVIPTQPHNLGYGRIASDSEQFSWIATKKPNAKGANCERLRAIFHTHTHTHTHTCT